MAPIYFLEISSEKAEALRQSGFNLTEQVAELDRSDWIGVPQKFSGFDYGFFVAPARLAYCSAVEKVEQTLDRGLPNTSEDSLNREFIGDIT